MSNQIPNALFKYDINGVTYYETLPDYGVSRSFTRVNDTKEVKDYIAQQKAMPAYIPGQAIGGTRYDAQSVAKGAEEALAKFESQPMSEYLYSYTNPTTGEKLNMVTQDWINNSLKTPVAYGGSGANQPGQLPVNQATVDKFNAGQGGISPQQFKDQNAQMATQPQQPAVNTISNTTGNSQQVPQTIMDQWSKIQEQAKQIGITTTTATPTPVVNPTSTSTGNISQDISNLYSVVAPGQSSDQVKSLQQALINAGYSIPAGATGFYGSQTQSAIDKWKSTLGSTGNGLQGTPSVSGTPTTGTNTGVAQAQTPTAPSDFISQYNATITQLGVPTIKSAYEKAVKEQNDLQQELNDKIADINDDPWASQSVKDRQISQMQKRYETRLNTLTNTQKLYDALYSEGIAEAKFLTTGEITQQNNLMEAAQKKAEALTKLNSQIIERDGNKVLETWDDSGKLIKETILGKSTTSSNSSKVTDTDIKTSIDQQLLTNNSYGTDKKVSWETYLWMNQNWINNGGKQSTFMLNYPISNYLDANNQKNYQSNAKDYLAQILKAESSAQAISNILNPQ